MTMPAASEDRYAVADAPPRRWRDIVLSWEVILVILLAVTIIVNTIASPYFLDVFNLADATFNFSEKAIVALAMALLVLVRDIDLSVAAIIALASTAMGAAAQAGFQTPALVGVGLCVGLLCGAFNGVLVARIGLPSIVVTIGTMSLFRGIAQIVLGDRAYGGYPASFAWFGQGYMSDFSWWPTLPGFEVVTFEMVAFVIFALAFGILLHWTAFGRRIYAIGNNAFAAQFSGIPVQRTKFALFLLTGVMSGFAAICLTSRLGSTRHTIAAGWELEVVTMAVLGGVSILGGSGTIPGVVLAAIVMGLVTFGLGLLNVPGIVMSIFIGLLLILVIALPIVIRRIRSKAAA